MPKLKKLLSFRKKPSALSAKKDEDAQSHSSNVSLSSLPGNKSGSTANLAASVEQLGSYEVKEKDLSKFLKAAWNGDLTKLKQIASKKVNWDDSDKYKRTALHLACSRGHEEVVDFLVTHGANVNLSDIEGKTPLIKACENNCTKIAECLLNNACEANVFDGVQLTAFHYAAGHGNIDIGYLLADNDAKLDPKDKEQVTPLHIASEMGHKAFVEFLLSEYIAVDCTDTHGRTPLMAACIDGHADIVELLLENKADVNLTDKDGLSAHELANTNNHPSITKLLDGQMKKKLVSPPSGDGSKKSATEMFSPAAQSLKDMFSSGGSTPSHSGSIFGGPAVNTGGKVEKSEDSKSEDLNDNLSWADSEDLASSNEFDKKPQLFNIGEMLKKKEAERKAQSKIPTRKSSSSPDKSSRTPSPNKSLAKVPSADLAHSSKENLSKIPIRPKSSSPMQGVSPAKSAENISMIPTRSLSPVAVSPSKSLTSLSKIPKLADSGNFTPSNTKKGINKLPWQRDQLSDDSESEWDDEGEVDLSGSGKKTVASIESGTGKKSVASIESGTGKKALGSSSSNSPDDGDKQNAANTKGDTEGSSKKRDRIPTFTAPPPPPPEVQFSIDASSDFDSSQPNDSFSDFPLSEMDGSKENRKSAAGNIMPSPKHFADIPQEVDDSFSDFPLSDMDGSKESGKTAAENIVPSPEHFADKSESRGDEFSNEESEEDRPVSRQTVIDSKEFAKKAQRDSNVGEHKLSADVGKPGKADALEGESKTSRKDESDWDSDLSESLNVAANLPPAPPPPAQLGSDFELSSSDEESESEFDLDKIIQQRADGKEEAQEGIFQTEVITPRDTKPIKLPIDDADDDDIEKQMFELAMSQNTLRATSADINRAASKKASIDDKSKNVAHPFDFGSDVSDVSDPEGLNDFKDEGGDVNNNYLGTNDVTAKDIFAAAGVDVTDNSESETESEWEKELFQKRLSASLSREISSEEDSKQKGKEDSKTREETEIGKVASNDAKLASDRSPPKDVIPRDSTSSKKDHVQEDIILCGDRVSNILHETIRKENEIEREKEQNRISEFEASRKAHEELLAAEIAEEIKQEMMADDMDLEFDSSSDFSFTPDFEASPVMQEVVSPKFELPEHINYEDSDHDVSGKQDCDNADGNSASEKDEDELKNEEEIKSKLQDILRSNTVQAPSPDKLDQLIDKQSQVNDELKRRFGLDARQERERIISEAMHKKEEVQRELEQQKEAMRMEEQRLKQEETRLKKEENRLKKLEEQERMRNEKIAQDEKRLLLFKQEQEKKLEEKARERMEALSNMEADLKKRAEEDLQRLLNEEDDQRKNKLSADEKQLREKLEKEKEIRNKELELQYEEDKIKLREEFEKELKLKEGLWEKQNLEREIEMQKKLAEIEDNKKKEFEKEKKQLSQRVSELENNKKKEIEEHVEQVKEKELQKLKGEEEVMRERLKKEEEEFKLKKEEEEKKLKRELMERKETLDKLEMERKRALEKEEEVQRRKLSEEGKQQRIKLEEEREIILKQLNEQNEQMKNKYEDEFKFKEEQLLRKMREEEELLRKKVEGIEIKRKQLEETIETKENELLLETSLVEKQKKEDEVEMGKLTKLAEEENKVLRLKQEQAKEMEDIAEKKKEIEKMEAKLREEKEEEIKAKEQLLEKRYQEKEKELMNKFAEISETQMNELEKQAKIKEEEIMTKVKTIEEQKNKELKEKEESLYQHETLNTDRFEDLERNYRRREYELEMQLADLREQQRKEPESRQIEVQTEDDFDFDISNIRENSPRKSSTPLGYSGHVSDLQKELNDSKRQAEGYKEKSSVLERVGREMQYDMEEMHKMIEVLNQSHKEKDKRGNEVEMELQSMKYKLEKEVEEKVVAEKLCDQLKDHLAVIEGKLTSESDLRRSLDLDKQKKENELESCRQSILRLEGELQEGKSFLETERNERILSDNRYQEKIREHERVKMEAEKSSSNHVEAVNKLQQTDGERKEAENHIQLLQVELANTKAELSRTQSVLDELKLTSDGEIIKLREKLDSKTEQLGTVEKNLFQLQLQYENEKSNRGSIEEKLTDKVQNESDARQKLEEEIDSLREQLGKSRDDFDHLKGKLTAADHEIESTTLKMSHDKNYVERDLSITKEQLMAVQEKLAEKEIQTEKLSDELRSSVSSLTESRSDATKAYKALEESKTAVAQLEGNLREEKMVSNKLESKLEAAHERINLLQSECDKLSKELTGVKAENANRDRSAYEKQDSANMHLATMKDNFNQEKSELLLKNEQNNLLIDKLQNQLIETEEKLKEKRNELSKRIQDNEETARCFNNEKISKAKSEMDIERLMRENSDLKKTLEDLREQIRTLNREKGALESKANDLKQELEKSEQLCMEMTQRVQKKDGDIENLRLENNEVRLNLSEMKKLKCSVEADLREEKGRTNNARDELVDSNKARYNLESLLNNIKGNNLTLEEQLTNESLNRSAREREAEEHKGLWESEVKSRSRIGMKVIELEKQIAEMKRDVEEEQRKARKAIDQKKSADSKNEMYEKRSLQHQQEVSALRNKLKQYQRKLKDTEGNDARLPAMQAEFDLERQSMSANLSKLRRQLDQLSERLTHEQEMRDSEEKKNREQLKELTDLKTNDKVQQYELEKLESKCRELHTELDRQKAYYERNFCPVEELEDFKKALETKARLDLNKKLQEVNMHLEEQSLAREAFDKLRSGIEKKTKSEFEDTVTQLKNDLTEVKATIHEGLVQRDTSTMEAKRFRELFETERSNSERLSGKLSKTNERLAFERNRTNYLFDETINKSKVTKKLFEESLEKDRKNSLSPRFQVQEDLGLNPSYYRPKLWSTPVSTVTSKSPFTSPDPLASIKRRNLLS